MATGYVKVSFDEIEIGKTYYFEYYRNHKLVYEPVVVFDKTDKKVFYKYEDNWREYQNRS